MKPETLLEFTKPRGWETWLKKNHTTSDGVTIRIAKLSSGLSSITYPEALDVALCYGWIDGRKKGDGESHYTQRFTPRTKTSIWSKVNRDKVAALIKSGRMQPAGLAEVERAKADGRWDAAYGAFSTDAMPLDLKAALDKSAKAKSFYAKLNSRNRYAILFRLHTAKKPETRAKRLATFINMLEAHETLHPQ